MPRKSSTYTVINSERESREIYVSGRNAWALDQLREAGGKGCTPITHPAPRWSAYVFNLRALGIEIETIHEPHGGAYAGTHARYVLRSAVSLAGGTR